MEKKTPLCPLRKIFALFAVKGKEEETRYDMKEKCLCPTQVYNRRMTSRKK
jgi:hypothetical protein